MSYLIETVTPPFAALAQDPAPAPAPKEEGYSPVLVVSAIVLGLLIGDGLLKKKYPDQRKHYSYI